MLLPPVQDGKGVLDHQLLVGLQLTGPNLLHWKVIELILDNSLTFAGGLSGLRLRWRWLMCAEGEVIQAVGDVPDDLFLILAAEGSHGLLLGVQEDGDLV